jgi:hypothetical protein
MVRRGIFLSLAVVALAVLFWVVLLGGLLAGAAGAGGGGLLAFGALGVALFLLMIPLGVLGAVFFFMGAWRVWATLREREAAAGARKPLSPGAQLTMYLVPYVNLVTMWIAAYRTQSHLNAMWQDRVIQ